MRKIIFFLSLLTLPCFAQQERCTSPCQFVSGFEGDGTGLVDWSSINLGNSIIVHPSTAQAAHGSASLAVGPGTATDNTGWVNKTIPTFTSGNTYYFRIYVYIPSGSIPVSTTIKPLTLGTGANTSTTVLYLYTNSSGNIYELSWYDNIFGGLNSVPITFNMNAWNYIDLSYTASSTSGSGLQAWVNGTSAGSVTNQAAAGVGYNNVLIGNENFGAVINLGKYYYIDDFQESTTGPIGAYAAPSPTTWFMSTTGSDSNSGTSSGSPWLTPNHAVNCGDTITAAAGTYSAQTSFGFSACSTHNVTWLNCATFDTCKIAVSFGNGNDLQINQSSWGVQGWEATNTSGSTTGGTCFTAYPATNNGSSIFNIVFANDIASTCAGGGFSTRSAGTASVDYVAMVGDVAYGVGATNTFCAAGFSVGSPVAADSVAGTHIYLGGLYSALSSNPTGCFDGESFILDTFDGSSIMPIAYTGQAVLDNSISIQAGGPGIVMEFNQDNTTVPAGPYAHMYGRHLTSWNSSTGTNLSGGTNAGEYMLYQVENTELFSSIGQANTVGIGGDAANPEFAIYGFKLDATDHVYNDNPYSAGGHFTSAVTSTGFSFGPNNFTSNPVFANPVAPSAPSCGSSANVPACVATWIANFTATAAAASGYGYQPISTTSVYDPLYPQWLCSVSIPTGLVTPGCLPGDHRE